MILTSGNTYIITGNVYTGNVYIANNVTLIFNDDYVLDVRGNIIIGCNDIDTSNTNSPSQSILITNKIQSKKGKIQIEGLSAFCNAKFDNLYSIYFFLSYPFHRINNCEFHNMYRALDFNHNTYASSSQNHTITNNKFINSTYAIHNAYNMVITNNTFHNIGYRSIYVNRPSKLYFFHTEIYNNIFIKSSIAIQTEASGVDVKYNTFTNNGHGIIIANSDGYIYYNTFMNNSIAIKITATAPQDVHYNNFINNTQSISIHYINNGIGDQLNCDLNYFGTSSTNQQIISQQIDDVCSGTVGSKPGLIKWWPWYTEPIQYSFNSIPDTYPQQFTFSILECKGFNAYSAIIGDVETVNVLYTENITLKASKSPYYVVNDVYLRDGVSLIIEPSVEIIFMDDHEIVTKGPVNMGCDHLDTFSDNNIIGLTSKNSAIFIHNFNESQQEGRISIGGLGSLCNVMVNGFGGIVPRGDFIMDNCQLNNMNSCVDFQNFGVKRVTMITDNKFTNSDSGLSQINVAEVRNNVFENIKYIGIWFSDNITVYNNTFMNVKNNLITTTGIHSITSKNEVGNITYNIFINFNQAIDIFNGINYIYYNQFIGNHFGISIGPEIQNDGTSSPQYIHYNNFINNTFSMQMTASYRDDYRDDYRNDEKNCNYNYYGISSTDQAVVSQQIYDACDKHSTGLITYWPWYTQPIDFQSLPNNYPPQSTFTIFECHPSDNYTNIIGNKLNAVYINNTTLKSVNSPYYVASDVLVRKWVTLTIEPGAEIIFLNGYIITIYGTIIMGCKDYNTFNDRHRGIISEKSAILVHGINDSRVGGIYVYAQSGTPLFCNVKFYNLNTAIDFTPRGTELIVDNCEFINTSHGISVEDYGYSYSGTITDSIFMNIHCGIYNPRSMIIENNIFQKILTGISLLESNTVRYNDFIDNDVAIYIYRSQSAINYNNFINSTINIQFYSYQDIVVLCNYNYNGYVDNILNPKLISNKMKDSCTKYESGILQFWPYFDSPLNLSDIYNINNNSAGLVTFNFVDCATITYGGSIAKYITKAPTPSPTLQPTDPTLSPTPSPTQSTSNPTSNPTQSPTDQTEKPTSSPTMYPTKPTFMPTVDPTDDPTSSPTNQPTFTGNPTMQPTANTESPTINPTIYPTLQPTNSTTLPSLNPTVNPTSNPSTIPTLTPTVPPTIDPTPNPSFIQTTANPTSFFVSIETTTASQGSNSEDDHSKQKSASIIWIIVIVVVIIMVIGVITGLYLYKRQTSKNRNSNNLNDSLQLEILPITQKNDK